MKATTAMNITLFVRYLKLRKELSKAFVAIRHAAWNDRRAIWSKLWYSSEAIDELRKLGYTVDESGNEICIMW